MYVDYLFYKETFKGNFIHDEDFARLAARASEYLNRITIGRVDLDTLSAKMAVCAVAEAWQINEQGGDIASQSVGSWSKTYNRKAKTDEERLLNAAMFYIGSPGLFTRWI